MHSITKWIGGHGIAIGGAIIDGGRFDWQASDKFPTLTEPYAGYHGIVFAEEFGPSAFIMRARAEGLRDFGACLSPTNALHLLQGVETLALRMERHIENTAAVLAFLRKQRRGRLGAASVAGKRIPIMRWRKDCCRAAQDRSSALASRAGAPPAASSSRPCGSSSHLANVGDAKTLVIHPASTTHQQMDAAALAAAGVGEELIRLSVGLEAADDIIDDFAQALRASQKA